MTRVLEPEWMDDPAIDPALHRQALAGLARLNAWGRNGESYGPALRQAAARLRGTGRPLRWVDVACGSGDTLRRWAGRFRRRGWPAEFLGVDLSPTAVEAAAEGAQGVAFRRADVFAEAIPGAPFDVATCSLFLHHLDDAAATELLRRLAGLAPLVLVEDLDRSRVALAVVWTACRLLSRSPVVHKDGPQSVRAAYRPAEALALAEAAGLAGATVRRRWPTGWLLTWQGPAAPVGRAT